MSTSEEDVILPFSPLRKVIAENANIRINYPSCVSGARNRCHSFARENSTSERRENCEKTSKTHTNSSCHVRFRENSTEFPLLNASFSWDGIRVKKSVHCGMAVSVEQGVVVPIVKNVEAVKSTKLQQKSKCLQKKQDHPTAIEPHTRWDIYLNHFGVS